MRLTLRCIVLLFILGIAGRNLAQTALSLHGSIVDPTGAGISGATVQLATSGGATISQSLTDNRGDFTLSNLPRGNFSLVIPAYSGFASRTVAIRLPGDVSGFTG